MMNVNLRASFLLVKGVVERMRDQSWARIVFMSSIAAHGGGVMGCRELAYSNAIPDLLTRRRRPYQDDASSKGGLTSMMKNLASQLAEFNTSVNDVGPAMIQDTSIFPDARAIPEVASSIPLGRMGDPEDVANVVTMLAMTGYMTVQSILLAGGLK